MNIPHGFLWQRTERLLNNVVVCSRWRNSSGLDNTSDRGAFNEYTYNQDQ